MDAYETISARQTRDEMTNFLLDRLTNPIIAGIQSIFQEALDVCKSADEMEKYLITFQNLLVRIRRWSPEIIQREYERIKKDSGCEYLDVIITGVHVHYLNLISATRPSDKTKTVNVHIVHADEFIHKVYIQCATQLYRNVYLYNIQVPSMQRLRNQREIEQIVQACILKTVRDNIPIDTLLKSYLAETPVKDVTEEIKEEILPEPTPLPTTDCVAVTTAEYPVSIDTETPRLTFNDADEHLLEDGQRQTVIVEKTAENLEQISNLRAEERRALEAMEGDEEEMSLVIGDDLADIPLEVSVLTDGEEPFVDELNIDNDIEILD